jgi:hypothetical protein
LKFRHFFPERLCGQLQAKEMIVNLQVGQQQKFLDAGE